MMGVFEGNLVLSGGESANAQTSMVAEAETLLAFAARQHSEDVAKLLVRVHALREQAAGLRPGPTSDDGRRRLDHPELKTTYPEVTVRGLVALSMKYRRELGKLLKEAVGLSIKLAIAHEDLEEHRRLEEQARSKHLVKDDVGLYPAAAIAVNRLYKDHSITHHHWASATPDRLRRVAAVLIGREGE